jgi:hypothetical protein
MLLAVSVAILVGVAQSPCQLSRERSIGAQGYRLRENRCEGLFVKPVQASSRLQLRGFHLGAPDYDLAIDDHLTVTVIGGGNGERGGVLLARSTLAGQYYQMDTTELEEDGHFLWSTTVLRDASVRVQPSDLALVYQWRTGAGVTHVRPVAVQGIQPARARRLYFIVLSEQPLSRIDLAISTAAGQPVRERSPLTGRAVHPPGVPIEVPFVVSESGEYIVTFYTRAANGAQSHLEFRAHVPPAAVR